MAAPSSPLLAPMPASNSGNATNGFASMEYGENDHFIRLALDLPNVNAKDVSVEFQRGILLVRGSREISLGPGIRHEHKFCRRFAMDTDVVNVQRIQANLNKRGILTIMAPKMRQPTTLQIQVTQEDDSVFEESITKSFEQQQDQVEEEKEVKMVAVACEKEEKKLEEVESTPAEPAALPNVVSMASASEALSHKTVAMKRRHKTSQQSHLMIRRSMSTQKLRKNRNATWSR